MAGIPFIKSFDPSYGDVQVVSPLIRRIVANNPGPFTYTGTGVYIVGHGSVAVIDPGPNDSSHIAAIQNALANEVISHILVTHSHADHSQSAKPLAQSAGCPVVGLSARPHAENAVKLEAGEDPSFAPDIAAIDGLTCHGPGWTLEAIETPGHTSNHVCYALREENAVFSGDHIMGWATSVVIPPDGHMGSYLQSLRKIRDRNFSVIYPTHGAPIENDPNGFVDAYISHRIAREETVRAAVQGGLESIKAMVEQIYADVDPRLHPAAAQSVLAHLIFLVEKGEVTTDEDTPTLNSRYRPS